MNKFSLKEYQTLLSKKLAERDIIIKEITSVQEKVNRLNKEISSIKAEMSSKIESGVEPITEHALLRYIENVMGVDIKKVKSDILSYIEPIANIKYDLIKAIDGKSFKFVMKGKQLITVVKL